MRKGGNTKYPQASLMLLNVKISQNDTTEVWKRLWSSP